MPAHNIVECGDVVLTWTREQDRDILRACRNTGPRSKTFIALAKSFPGKTSMQVGFLCALFWEFHYLYFNRFYLRNLTAISTHSKSKCGIVIVIPLYFQVRDRFFTLMQLMKKAQKAAERKARKSAKTPVKQAQSSKPGAKKAKIMLDGEEPGPSGQNQESSSKVS